MPEPLNLSPTAWALLDMLQQQLGVSIEVLDTNLRVVAPAGPAEAVSLVDQPGIATEAARSVRTGEVRISRAGGAPVGIFPLRLARQIAGVLLIAARAARQGEPPFPPEINVERAGHLARTALESDLSLTSQLAEAGFRTRRAHGILRFLSQLGSIEGEREIMSAVVHAATVWFDADCRIYERQPDGSYQLAAALPGSEPRPVSARIDAGRAERLVTARRVSSAGDLEDLGLAGRRDEVLVLAVGAARPEWLLILSGTIDQEVELTFGAIARVLTGEMHAHELTRVDAWQQRLALIAEEKRAPERVLLEMLEGLAADVSAESARVTLVTQDAERALAALGPAAAAQEAAAEPEPPVTAPPAVSYTATIEVAPGMLIHLGLRAAAPPRAVAGQASSWLKALQPWLREAVATITSRELVFEQAVEMSSFERRIQEEIERAKRFNLGLGLVVISSAPAERALDRAVGAIRSELRASDLMGRLRDGRIAVLLVHAEPAGADSVIGRVRDRLGAISEEISIAEVELGKAIFSHEMSSADALIEQARRHAERFELRN
jgi:hypothetical protein